MIRSLLVVLLMSCAMMVHAQSSMVIPLTVRNGNAVQVVEFGYSPYNTFGIDSDTLLGPFLEAPAPPDAPEYPLEVRMRTIPGRTTPGLGSTGTYKDFRNYRADNQIDSFLVRITGKGSINGLALNPTSITWPKFLDRYAANWEIKCLTGSVFPPTNMLAADSVVIPVDALAETYNVLIVKTGALATSHPAAFKTLVVGEPGFAIFEFPKFPPAVTMQFTSSPGAGAIYVARYADAPSNVSFAGAAPANVSKYRWVIAQAGLKTYSASIRFLYDQFPAGISSGSAVTIYKRAKEGTGAFQALTTSFTQGIPELRTTTSEFGEFVFGSANPFTGVAPANEQPLLFGLAQNYPNPFNPQTEIQFTVPERGHVRLEVYSLLGQMVRSLVAEEVSAGTHRVSFDAGRLPSGIYLTVLRAGGKVFTRRMALVR